MQSSSSSGRKVTIRWPFFIRVAWIAILRIHLPAESIMAAKKTQATLKRTVEALARIDAGRRVRISSRRWVEPACVDRKGFLHIDSERTTLRSCPALTPQKHCSTNEYVQTLFHVLQDCLPPQRFGFTSGTEPTACTSSSQPTLTWQRSTRV